MHMFASCTCIKVLIWVFVSLLIFFAFHNLSASANWVQEAVSQKLEMWGSNMNMITTVIGFGMSATFIVFICVRIICRRLRGVESGPMFEIESRNDLEQVKLFLYLLFQNCFFTKFCCKNSVEPVFTWNFFLCFGSQSIGLMALNRCWSLQFPP